MKLEFLRVAVIGLGAMGKALALALLDAGAEVRVWNRTKSKSEALKDQGAIVCESAYDAISGSTYVVVCVSDYAAWLSVMESQNVKHALVNRNVIQLTTGTMAQVKEHKRLIDQFGSCLIDGSIICFPSQIGTEDASLVVAGNQSSLDSCVDILEAIAPSYTYLGDNIIAPVVLGRALISQALGSIFGAINGAALCEAGGISLSHYSKYLCRSNPILKEELQRICNSIESDDTVSTEASIKTWSEGQTAILDVANALDTDTSFQAALKSLFQRASADGLGEHDISALIRVFGAKH